MVSSRVPSARGARTIPEDAAPGAPRAADLESSLRNFLLGFFPGLSCRGRFPVRAATLRMGGFIVFVGANDLLHQVVTYHVSFSELHQADSFDLAAHFKRFDQPALLSLRQVKKSGLVEALEECGDRKSTRLNSSHSQISYAVFCLKKK